MTVKVYNSKNYPNLKINGLAGSLIPILDEILINSGWTKSFTGVSKAVYKNGIGSNQVFFRFDDLGYPVALGRNAGIRGYQTMSNIDTGTEEFPSTTTHSAQGGTIRKSVSADAVSREWYAVVTEKICYLFICSADTPIDAYSHFIFGDFQSYKTLEKRNSFIMSASGNLDATTFSIGQYGLNLPGNALLSATSLFIAGYANTGAVYDTGLGAYATGLYGTISGDVTKAYNAYEGELYGPISIDTQDIRVSPVFISNPNASNSPMLRGKLNGLFFPLNNNYNSGGFVANNGNFPEYDEIYLNGILQVGRKFAMVKISNTSYIFIEISNTW